MRMIVGALLSLLLVAAACKDKKAPPQSGKFYECDTDQQCKADEVCLTHACSPSEKTSAAAAAKPDKGLKVRVKSITFRAALPDEESKEFEGGRDPYVNLANPEPAIAKMHGKDTVVLRHPTVDLLIDYPLNRPITVTLKAPSAAGFTRAELVRRISNAYQRIYAEEERTAAQKTVPLGKRGTLRNRNRTNGKYGIWGHDLADLDLHTVRVMKHPNGQLSLELDIDS